MRKSILFVGGGIETRPGVCLAKEMGLRVLVSDRNPIAPSFAVADVALVADTYDARATIEALRGSGETLHGVLCLGTDIPLTVATIAQFFGLPGLKIETALLACDKLAMKDRFVERGVKIPWYAPLADAAELCGHLAERGPSLVVKPVDSRGARGVIRLTPQVNPDWAFSYAQSFSPTDRVMAEAYLPGPQISTESLVVDGRVYTPGFSDRNYGLLEHYAPFFIEDGGDLPSFLAESVQERVKQLAADAALALDVHDGVVKGDLVVCNGEPFVIEVATRLSGGYFCTHSIPANTGVELVRLAIKQAVGEAVDETALLPRFQRPVCQRYLFPGPGRVTRVEGVDAVAADPNVLFLEVRVKAGDVISPIENHPGRAGVLMASGSSREAARARAEAAVEHIHIHTVPVEP